MKKEKNKNLIFLILGMIFAIIASIFYRNNLACTLFGICLMALSINGFKLSEKTYFFTSLITILLKYILVIIGNRGIDLEIFTYISTEMIIPIATPSILSIATVINKIKNKKYNTSSIVTLCLSLLLLVFLAYIVKVNGMYTICEFY